jgi:hypothetical protein
MRVDSDGLPALGRAPLTLGVRIAGPFADVRVLDDGTIVPGTGGMSAFVDPRKMPKSLRPRTLTEKPGESPHPIFSLKEKSLPEPLRFRMNQTHHGLVEPREQCRIDVYEDHLVSTRLDWKVAYAGSK